MQAYMRQLKADLTKEIDNGVNRIIRRLELMETRVRDDIEGLRNELVPGVRVVCDI